MLNTNTYNYNVEYYDARTSRTNLIISVITIISNFKKNYWWENGWQKKNIIQITVFEYALFMFFFFVDTSIYVYIHNRFE